MLLRLLSILFALVFTAHALHCQQGFYLKIGDAKPYLDNATSFLCPTTVKSCIKEKLWTTGQSGKTVAGIRYDCDSANQCSQNYMALAQDCTRPFDIYIGDMCCCTTDNCNTDVDLSGASSLSLLLPISLLFFSHFSI